MLTGGHARLDMHDDVALTFLSSHQLSIRRDPHIFTSVFCVVLECV